MTLSLMEGLLTAIVYLLGGAFALFIYEAYKRTRQRNLLLLAVGMFIMIVGSNLHLLALATDSMAPGLARVLSLCIEIPGILIMLYSAIR